MENNRTEILREIESELASLKRQVLALEEKLEALRQEPVQEETPVEESDFTDMEIGVSDLPEAAAPVVEEIPAQVRIDEPMPEPESVPEPVEEPVVEAVIEDLPEPEPTPAPTPALVEPEPAPAEPAPVAPKPVAPRPETERLPWRLERHLAVRPGPVHRHAVQGGLRPVRQDHQRTERTCEPGRGRGLSPGALPGLEPQVRHRL